jgi:hypothetical protein
MSFVRRGLPLYVLLLSATLLAFSGILNAQQVFGSIVGAVTDPSGSAVNNAKVTIKDEAKGTSFEVNTNESGNYTKGQLIPGTYSVTVEASGFQKAVSTNVLVSVDQVARVDLALTVGDVTQQIEVTAAAPLLQTDRADVAQTFSSQQLQSLPNIGRNVQSFELLNPGVVKLPWQHASSENPQGSVQTMVNGRYFDSTGYELDGTVNQDPILGIIVINPTMDSVNEVKQANQDYDSEFGYMGAGLLTYSTKSGSNAFHGDAFEYLFLNTPGFQSFARNPFTETGPVPTVQQNQFGGSLSGRVIKDKLFFFADAQLTRNHQGSTVQTTVPTASERTGNLGDWLAGGPQFQIYDPASSPDPASRTPFPGNVIPAGRLSPQALALLNYFPQPNSVARGTLFRNNYLASGTDIIEGNLWNTRWDYYGNEKNTFFGRYSYAKYNQNAPTAFGPLAGGPSFPAFGFAGFSDALNQSLAAGWTHTHSPTVINEFRFGYMRYHVVVTPGGIGTAPATAAGIPGLNLDSFYTSGMPSIDIHNPGDSDQGQNGRTQLGYALNNNRCNCPLEEFERQYQFVDNVSKIYGNHTFKVGTDVRYAQNLRVPSDNHRAGELRFEPEYTSLATATGSTGGLGLAAFLLGQTTTFNRYVSSSTNAQERQKRIFWYGQDTWRATSKLTINYGTRWEWIFPETVNDPGNGAALNLATGNLDVFGRGLISNHGYQQMNWKEFAPRVGVAYQVMPKTVIRAGYGWSYSLGTFGSTFGHNVTQNPPVLSNQSLNRPNQFSSVFSLAQGPPQPTTVTPNINGSVPCPVGTNCKARPSLFVMPVTYAYNFTVEQQLTRKVSASAGYVGNHTRHGPLGTSQNFNVNEPLLIPGVSDVNQNIGRPYFAKYGWTQTIDYYCNCANARYDSLQVMFKVNAAAGYTLQGNYTYQLAQGDGWGSDNSYTFLYNRQLGRGNADNIPTKQFVLAQSYEIPFGRGRRWGSNANRWVDLTLGGWNVSGITTYYSGIPFNPSLGGTHTAPVGPNDRPNKGSGDPFQGARGDRTQWFVGGLGSAFTLPANNTFGNYPINDLHGPHFINQDVSVLKAFALTERFKFTLRADATNAFNHTNLGQPNTNVLDTNAGQITNTAFGGSYLMRRMQFSGTLNF